MASRKQQRRREKERRHEYELILVDEAGEERPVDPAELRAQRRGKDGSKSKTGNGNTASTRGGRAAIREVKPPSWDRVVKRTLAFGVFMFLVLSFVGHRHMSLGARIVPTLLYTVVFGPFLYLIDRLQYRMYLKKIGGEPPAAPPPPARPEGGSDDDGLVAQLRRRFGL